MKKYPSIEQFRNVIRELKLNCDYQGKDENDNPIYKQTSVYPTVKFHGTVKLHGTNAAIVKYSDGRIEFQSRERVLSLTEDNAKFMLSMSNKKLDFLFDNITFTDYCAVYGEWCGEGVQTGVAISKLPKMFVIFGCKVDDRWVNNLKFDHSQQIYNIQEFPTYVVDVDFNQPEYAQNKFVTLTEEVENECPVGKHFEVNGIGEGIVWVGYHNEKRYTFKTKGEKHSVSKVRTVASVDVEQIESLNAFVDYALTENRLQQGLEKLKELGKVIDQSSTGDFLRWIINDIIKEEQDTIIENQLDLKKLNSLISNKARQWFFNNF